MSEGWAKIPKIAEYMGFSERTVRELLKRGLRHSRMDTGTILVKYAWADEFLEQFEATSNEVETIVDEVMRDL